MADLHEAEARAAARQILRDAYRFDVDILAHEMTARVRRGEFDKTFPWFWESFDDVILKHPRVTELSLALETVVYSDNRNAIESDFIRGWSTELKSPWASFELPFAPETGEPCDISLPAWTAIAYHSFYRDVSRRLYELLGDTPERYIAARLGIDWKGD